MANLTFTDVLLIGAVGTIALVLLSYWFSGVMAKKGWNWQVKNKKRKPRATAKKSN